MSITYRSKRDGDARPPGRSLLGLPLLDASRKRLLENRELLKPARVLNGGLNSIHEKMEIMETTLPPHLRLIIKTRRYSLSYR